MVNAEQDAQRVPESSSMQAVKSTELRRTDDGLVDHLPPVSTPD